MCWRCAPCLLSLARSCWGHSEFGGRRQAKQTIPDLIRQTVTAPESGTLRCLVLWRARYSARTLRNDNNSCRDDAGRCMRVIVEDGRQPPFTFADGPVLPPCIVLDLSAFDLADAVIRALRMAEIEPAHGGAGPYRETFGKFHADALAIEQLEQRTLLDMVRLRRIAGRRP